MEKIAKYFPGIPGNEALFPVMKKSGNFPGFGNGNSREINPIPPLKMTKMAEFRSTESTLTPKYTYNFER